MSSEWEEKQRKGAGGAVCVQFYRERRDDGKTSDFARSVPVHALCVYVCVCACLSVCLSVCVRALCISIATVL